MIDEALLRALVVLKNGKVYTTEPPLRQSKTQIVSIVYKQGSSLNSEMGTM